MMREINYTILGTKPKGGSYTNTGTHDKGEVFWYV